MAASDRSWSSANATVGVITATHDPAAERRLCRAAIWKSRLFPAPVGTRGGASFPKSACARTPPVPPRSIDDSRSSRFSVRGCGPPWHCASSRPPRRAGRHGGRRGPGRSSLARARSVEEGEASRECEAQPRRDRRAHCDKLGSDPILARRYADFDPRGGLRNLSPSAAPSYPVRATTQLSAP